MIRMSRAKLAALLFVSVAVGLGGCCGGAPSHKCDFTPYTSQTDGGDASAACGTQVCQAPQICCFKKIAPFASCIDPADSVTDDCETMDTSPPGCTSPQDCDGGAVCCASLTQGMVSCQPPPLCPEDGTTTFLACGTDQDCASSTIGRTCHFYAGDPDSGVTLSVCE